MNYEKIKCGICGFAAHILAPHIIDSHAITLAEYEKLHGSFLSDAAREKLKSIETTADNEKVEVNIKKTFGTLAPITSPVTWGWKFPHERTPKLEPNYVFRPELLILLLAAHENKSDKLLFTGPTGSGKSTAIEQVAARLNVPFYRVNLDNEITKADFIGQYILKGDETTYQYGVLPLAMKGGAWLLVDEWDMGNPGVTAALQAVLEDKPLQIGDTGEIVEPAEGFRIFATGNTIGQGDESGLYNGTQVQNFAQLDRFTMVDYVDYPSVAIETKIVAKQCNLENDSKLKLALGVSELSEKDNAKKIVSHLIKTGNLIRDSFKKEEISTTMSTRTLVNIGKKFLMFQNIKKAYEVAFLNKLTPSDREFCEQIIQREWDV